MKWHHTDGIKLNDFLSHLSQTKMVGLTGRVDKRKAIFIQYRKHNLDILKVLIVLNHFPFIMDSDSINFSWYSETKRLLK